MIVFNHNLIQAAGIALVVLWAALFSPATQADDYYNKFFLPTGSFVMLGKTAHDSNPEMWNVVRMLYPNAKGVTVSTQTGTTTCHVCTLEDFK